MRSHATACLLASTALIASARADPGTAFFKEEIAPILERQCYECHSHESGKAKGGLVLDSRVGWEKGGSRPAVVLGKPDESLLIEAVRHGNEDLRMPPKRKLPADEIALLEKWVAMGAPDPRTSSAPGTDPARLWALQPIRRHEPPVVSKEDWPRDESDRFILAGLEDAGLEPAADAVIESFELAFRMQTETPKLVDLSSESEATKKHYGIGEKTTDQFGRQCLLARRFAEAGVRFVQVTLDGWDHHGTIAKSLPGQCAKGDKPVAGLLSDLKSRGLLDDTLVLWGGEFGRMPHTQQNNGLGQASGREHNPHGFTMWMAVGGVKGGIAHGATDDYAYHAVDGQVHINDLHATMLHLMGMDHERLTFEHFGFDHRLTGVAGNVVEEILA